MPGSIDGANVGYSNADPLPIIIPIISIYMLD